MTCLYIDRVLKEREKNKNATVDASDEHQIRTKPSSLKSQDFSHLSDGLSAEGICTNKECRVHTKTVIGYHGFGLFLFHILLNQYPVFESDVRIKRFVFVRCFHQIQGQGLRGSPMSSAVQLEKV